MSDVCGWIHIGYTIEKDELQVYKPCSIQTKVQQTYHFIIKCIIILLTL